MATVTHQAAIRKLHQPLDMRKDAWRNLKRVLSALAKYGATPYPGMRRLGRDTRLDPTAVSRLLARAEKIGLISRERRPIPGRRDGFTYTLLFLQAVAEPVALATERGLRPLSSTTSRRESEVGRKGLRPPRPALRLVNRWAGTCVECGERIRPGDGFLHGKQPVHRFCDDGPPDPQVLREYMMATSSWQRENWEDLDGPQALGEDRSAPLPGSTVITSPASRLARQFTDRWHEVVQRYPQWSEYRSMHTGAAVGYIRSVLLERERLSPEHIEAYFDYFFAELADTSSSLAPKENQNVWQLFTGWWPNVSVPDPIIVREHNEKMAALYEAGQQAVEEGDAARKRLYAMLDAGETPSTEDYQAAGFSPPVRKWVG